MESVTHSTELNPHNCCSSCTHVCNVHIWRSVDNRHSNSIWFWMVSKRHVEECFKPNQFGSISISTSSLPHSALWVRARFLFTHDVIFIESFAIGCHRHFDENEKKTRFHWSNRLLIKKIVKSLQIDSSALLHRNRSQLPSNRSSPLTFQSTLFNLVVYLFLSLLSISLA